MEKVKKIRFTKGRPLFKYSLLIVTFTLAALIDPISIDGNPPQISGVETSRVSLEKTDKNIQSTSVSSATLDTPPNEPAKDEPHPESAETNVSPTPSVTPSVGLDAGDENNNNSDGLDTSQKATSSSVVATPTSTPSVQPTITTTPPPIQHNAPVCGNNICEENEYVPCPEGTNCVWVGSCPSDCSE